MIRIRKKDCLLLIGIMLGSVLVGCINVDVEETLADTQIENVDLSKIADGTYE